MHVGILDIGGNVASVFYTLKRIGHNPLVVKTFSHVDALVIPGQGRFDIVAKRLNGEREGILTFKGPVLGICAGMQLMFEASEEGKGAGLSVFPGRLARLPAQPNTAIPHVGWAKCSDDRYYYFAHSYAVPFKKQGWATLACAYGTKRFIAACKKDNFTGCQFHPEKSGDAGMEFLKAALL